MEMETYDCVVVGAGCYGLAAAKQYHFTHPLDSLRIFDSQASLGGTWADERLYPDLKTNNLLGTYEFPDFPMDPKRFGLERGRHIPGTGVNAYLKAYAAEFGLRECIQLRTKVTVAEHLEGDESGQGGDKGGWMLTLLDLDNPDGNQKQVHARRLIVASGLTSEPFMPRFQGEEDFGGRIFHSKDFLQNADTLQTERSVTVFGGHKFAWDAVYAYAKAGVEVNWVIRSTGNGACWMAPTHVTPFKRWLEELANTRFMTWFSPCIWSDASGYSGIRSFLHGTVLGRLLVNVFWAIVGNDVMTLNGYDSHPKTALLKPRVPMIYASPTFSILNYDLDIFDFIKSDKVHIHITEIDHLSPGRVHLANGISFESMTLISNSGWKPAASIKFLPEGIEGELGIPHLVTTDASPDDLGNRGDLLSRADGEILRRYPRLIDQPSLKEADQIPAGGKSKTADGQAPLTMSMLYRFMIPPSRRFLRRREIAFCGMVSSVSNVPNAHLQGLWISSYFAGLLVRDPSEAVEDDEAIKSLQYETVLHNRFCKWRFPADHKYPSFIFDSVSYWDMLMKDLGLRVHRKQDEGLIADLTRGYGPEEYSSINDEWKARKLKA